MYVFKGKEVWNHGRFGPGIYVDIILTKDSIILILYKIEKDNNVFHLHDLTIRKHIYTELQYILWLATKEGNKTIERRKKKNNNNNTEEKKRNNVK